MLINPDIQQFFNPNMRILIAEDESDISHTYKIALESRDHQVVVANNGIRCVEIYHEELQKRKKLLANSKEGQGDNLSRPNSQDNSHDEERYSNRVRLSNDGNNEFNITPQIAYPSISPFDAVVLDYKMPGKDGMEVAKEILDLNPDQRIVFASAYVEETLADSVKQLRRVVELLQKPFEIQAFIDTIEDKEVYEELKKLFVNIRAADQNEGSHAQSESGEPQPSTEQIRDMFECLRKIHKNRTF